MKYIKTWSMAMLAAAITTMGCSQSSHTPPPKPTSAAPGTSEEAPHEHGPGPNGGVVFDLGSGHAEFTIDHTRQECYLLILGDDEKTPLAVAASELTLVTKETKTEDGTVVPPMTITMKPQDAADGKASKFVGTDPGIGKVADFEGTVVGEIDGKPAQGSFKE